MSILSCTLALVLLMDVSGSISHEHYEMQRDATAQALASPEIVRLAEQREGIAVTVLMFSWRTMVVLPWRIISSQEQANDIASELSAISRPSSASTFTGTALEKSLDQFEHAPCREEMVVDISTDGPSDDTPLLAEQMRRAVSMGVTVNGLAINEPYSEEISQWFQENLRTPDGFIVEIHNMDSYHQAIRRKLVREIASIRLQE
jgi:Ca-activated chloride channel family protein